eukprot:TRINITY_DN19820_c0_g1_i3.p1 TRINITY_DN19820_c0_g1~~TRINITY_DN19820_c0_g1_i3.p1  ORF type:complete len:113 (-),score=3.21 TRINITY_DN19820_c0_g1_i3:98-436(-)
MPMMFMPDCIRCTQEMLEVERTELKRSVYNVTGCSFSPKQIAESIRRHIPGFKIHYDPDFRQVSAGALDCEGGYRRLRTRGRKALMIATLGRIGGGTMSLISMRWWTRCWLH